jgi:hypothetical protein
MACTGTARTFSFSFLFLQDSILLSSPAFTPCIRRFLALSWAGVKLLGFASPTKQRPPPPPQNFLGCGDDCL